MNSNPTISIILPAYNAEGTLQKAVESVLAQSFTDFELIIINDGSKDKTGPIADALAKSDPRIKVIHKTNEGASAARNDGMANALGNYILFVDSDDYVEENYILTFTSQKDKETTLLISGIEVLNTTISDRYSLSIGNKQKEQLSISDALLDGRLIFFGFTVGKLYSKRIIDEYGLRFPKDICFKEDLIFMLEYLKHCNQVKFIGNAGYNYIVQSNSLSTTKYPAQTLIDITERVLSSMYGIEIEWNEHRLSQLLYDFLALCVSEIFDSLYHYHKPSKKERIKQLKLLRKLLPKIEPFPNNYKTDDLLKRLFYYGAYGVFDLFQTKLYNHRYK